MTQLSKVDYWKKWEFFELLDDLRVAFKSLSDFKTDSESETKVKQEFSSALEDMIDDIEFGNHNDLTQIWDWFAPGGQWSIVMGQRDEELKDRIFERADRWKKASS